MSTDIHEAFLQLVRIGIGHTETTEITENVDWVALKALAERQGLSAVVLDGLNSLPLSSLETYKMPQMLRLEWIGEVLQSYEARYKSYEKAIGSLAKWYNQHGYKMMVLKGYACSLDWPKPEHRPSGDIDIWLFGKQNNADIALKNEGINVDNSHHHHTVFSWDGFMVENHYDFINVYHHRSHVALENVLKELGEDDSRFVEINDEKAYLPSPNLHALFLLKHASLHFVGTELTFRQILDWAFFVQKHGKDVDWKMLFPIIEGHGLMPFLNIINAICVEELGFDSRIFPTVKYNPNIKDRVVKEIFSSVYDGDNDSRFISRNINRYRRLKGNAWKHELCYKESMWSAFWSGVWGHLIKPKSI